MLKNQCKVSSTKFPIKISYDFSASQMKTKTEKNTHYNNISVSCSSKQK